MAEKNRCPHCHKYLPADAPRGVCPQCLLKAGLPNEPDIAVEGHSVIEGPGTIIDHYELLELIGEGGMGLVYLAEQKEPVKRKVALKIVKLGMDTKQVIARFEAERQTLAVLEHPNIAHVFDAGTTETGRPYFVMEYVEGKSITKYCDEQKLSVEERLGLFRQVCEGVHHAHQKGIIHRDIKPSNILVSIHGDKASPKIIDFGIAKAITQPLTEKTSFTEHGQLLGTPEYMSPEQAEMAYQDIDTRSDIYSLGVVLYELLTGVPPFDAKSLREGGIDHIQQVICEEEPRTPSARLTSLGDKAKTVAQSRRTQIITLTRRLHRELEWIPMKAMRKDRTRRYRSASELADDIQNYLTGTPLIAGPESTVYRTRKFVRKHAGSVAMVVLVAVAIVLGLVVSIMMGCRAEQARRQEAIARQQVEEALLRAEDAEKAAQEQAENYRRALYANRIALADLSYRDGSIQRVRELLEACPEDLRGWEWYRLDHISDQSYMTLRGHLDRVTSLAVSSDGKRIVSGSRDKNLKLWNVATSTELMTLSGHGEGVCSVSFSSDGERVVSGDLGGTIKVWDAVTGEELTTLAGHEDAAGALFTPDEKRIISASRDGTIKVWNAETGGEIMRLRAHEERLTRLDISPDAKRIASASMDNTVKVWDATTGDELISLHGHEVGVVSVAFSPDGKRIVSGGADNIIKVWDSETGDELMNLRGHEAWVLDVAWSPDGRQIVSAGRDWTIRVWDATTGDELKVLRGHEGFVRSVTFNPANDQLVSGSNDGMIKVWGPRVDREYMSFGDEVWQGGRFSPDGNRIVTGDQNGKITVWDRSSGAELMIIRGSKGDTIADVRFSPDGRRIFSSQIRKGTVWEAATGSELLSFNGNAGYVYAAFSPNGKYIATWIEEYWDEGSDDNTIKLRDAMSGEEIIILDGHEGELWGVVFSSDSKRLASCDINETIKVWDVETGKDTMTLKHGGGSFSIAFSPDGTYIASGGTDADNTIKLWDAESGEEIMTLKGHNRGIGSLVFSPDGRRLVSGGRDRTIKIWDVTTGVEVLTLKGDYGSGVEFSPDGETIAISAFGIASNLKLLETGLPADGYENRRTGAAVRKLVDKLYEKLNLYSKVIEELKADETLDESVRKLALQIANARLWEDEEKTE